MTVDEMTYMLRRAFGGEVPPNMQPVLRACAEWLYASPDIGHMLLECRDLISALNGVRSVVEDRLLAGEASAKEADL